MMRESTGPLLMAVFVDYDNVYLSLKRKNEDAAKRFSKDAGLWIREIENGGLISPTNTPTISTPRRIVLNRCYGNPVPRRNTSDNSTDMSSFPFVRHHFLRSGFEVIDCPPLTAQLKNSADIRMVVDALDLCYTKAHIDTFVVISGDSDFSPLVSKLRENAKTVIGIGVKNSTSDLLISNCDEFIYYDDLVRDQKSTKKRQSRRAPKKTAANQEPSTKKKQEDKADQAIALVLETVEAIQAERGDREKLWGSMVKQTLKRRRPGFNESFYGFRSFSDLLEEAQTRGQLVLEMDERSGGYLIRVAAQA